MDIYAIYAYKLVRCNDYGDWTQGAEVREADMGGAQNTLHQLFGATGTLFPVQEDEGDGARKYTCKVYGNDRRVVALRLQNEKEEHYWTDEDDPNDPMGTVTRKTVKSKPPTFVVIDCRPGCNILAVKIESDAWRNPDTVRDLMEASINACLKSLSRGFRVRLVTKMQSHEFFDYSKRRIKKEGRSVKNMTISFRTGKLNPAVEAVVKSSDFLKRLFSLIDKYGGASGEMTLNQPIGPRLIDRRRHDIENIVALVASDPQGYALDMTFDDDVTLHCGKDVRADLPMTPQGALELFHLGRKAERATQLKLAFDAEPQPDGSTYLLEGWLDSVADETKMMKDAETVRRKGSRKNRRKAS